MSQRYGMADGRCLTEFTSSRILNDQIMASKNIAFQDNYKYRSTLQAEGPAAFSLPVKNAACQTGKVVVLVENE
jgi:hypothetical protein